MSLIQILRRKDSTFSADLRRDLRNPIYAIRFISTYWRMKILLKAGKRR